MLARRLALGASLALFACGSAPPASSSTCDWLLCSHQGRVCANGECVPPQQPQCPGGCPATTPVCVNNQCARCGAHYQCWMWPGICKPDGACATPAEVLDVAPSRPLAPCDDEGPGTSYTPFCTVQAAVTAALARGIHYVHVGTDVNTVYGPVSVSTAGTDLGPLTMVATSSAVIAGGNLPALSVATPTMNQVTLTVFGFTLRSDAPATVVCDSGSTGSVTLTLASTNVEPAGAIASTGCNLSAY